jgi:hypothetical protein
MARSGPATVVPAAHPAVGTTVRGQAHDNIQQDTFMALSAMYVKANPTYRAVPWLRDWQAFWLEAVGAASPIPAWC